MEAEIAFREYVFSIEICEFDKFPTQNGVIAASHDESSVIRFEYMKTIPTQPQLDLWIFRQTAWVNC